MSDLVNPGEIEAIVGHPRHDEYHYARAVSSERTVYVLHSRRCVESTPDLRTCPLSVALDRGIEHHIPWSGWRRVQDRPVRVEIFRGWLVPEMSAKLAAEAAAEPERPTPPEETPKYHTCFEKRGAILNGPGDVARCRCAAAPPEETPTPEAGT